MHVDRGPDSDLGFYHIWIQHLAAFGHVCDRLAEAISARSAALLQNDLTARSILRDRPAALSRGRFVVVSETWPHANGATNAKAMLNTIFFMFSPLLVELRQ